MIAAPPKVGSINWDPPNTFYKIVGEYKFTKVGSFVSLIGRTSGRKGGVVSTICANENVAGENQKYTYICQDLVAATIGDNGDSGSPVFVCLDNKGQPTECPDDLAGKITNVKLVGIKWGGVRRNGKPFSVYSEIGSFTDPKQAGVQNAAHDLGPLKKCAEGGC
jgi:hypothetical protein